MLDTLSPGQNVRCTVVKVPGTEDQRQTILRLMRKDPTVTRRLRRSQMMRRRGMVVYNRGNRDWYKRETCGKIAHVLPGATWTFAYTLEYKPDLEAIGRFLKVEKA
jgi:hypothetical protein